MTMNGKEYFSASARAISRLAGAPREQRRLQNIRWGPKFSRWRRKTRPDLTRSINFAGGLLRHWAGWTRPAVELLEAVHESRRQGGRDA